MRRAPTVWLTAVLAVALFFSDSPLTFATTLPLTTWPEFQYDSSKNAAFDLPKLTTQWRTDTGAKINGGLAVVGTTLFADTFGKELLALDLRTGTIRWRVTAPDVMMSTPIVYDNIVVVGTGQSGQLMPTIYGNDSRAKLSGIWGRPQGDDMIAFSTVDGSKVWDFHTLGEDMPSPVLANGVLAFSNGDFHAYGLDPAKGTQLWQTPLIGVSTMASATAFGRNVVFADCGMGTPLHCYTTAVDVHSGDVQWIAPWGNEDCSPTLGDHRVFISGIEDATVPYEYGGYSYVAALEERTGRRLWSWRTAAPGPYTAIASAERAVAGTYVRGTYYQAITTDSTLRAFNGATGRLRWTFRSTAPIKMSPVVAGGTLYAGDTVGVLYMIDARSGHLRKAIVFSEPFSVSPPIVVGNTLFVANGSTIYAIALNV